MGLMRVAARTAVISGTATAVSGRVAQRQMAAAQGSAPAAPAGDESIAKVQELAALHAQGVLSDEEFAAAKAKTLGI